MSKVFHVPPARSAFWRIWLVAAVLIGAFVALVLNAKAAEAHVARHHHRHAHFARHHRVRQASLVEHLAGFARARVIDVAGVGGVATDVVREALRWVGHGNMTGTHEAWCADFDTFVLKRTGHQTIASHRARDAVQAGRPIGGPVPGAIMSMPHHTGFVVQVLGAGRVLLISGNHGHRVGLGVYSTRGARFALPA